MKLKELYNTFAKHKEATWIMEAQNAQILYQFIKDHDIKKVLDLGTGIGASVATVALALKEKGEDYHIDTVEIYDKCINLAKELTPIELQEHITFIKSDVKIWEHKDMPHLKFSYFDNIPDEEYDLIINDGPGPFMENGYWIDLPNATVTIMLLDGKIKPGCFVAWDGRQHMLKLLERYFSENFYIQKPIKGSDLNILKRRDNEVKLFDEKLELMKESTYFNEDIDTNNSETPLSETETAN